MDLKEFLMSFISVTTKQVITFITIVFTVNKTSIRSYYELLNIVNMNKKVSIFQTALS